MVGKAWGQPSSERKGLHGRRFSVAVRRLARGASARALAGRDRARRLLAGDRARRAGLLVRRVVARGRRGAARRRLGAARLRPRVLEPASGECRRPAPGRSRLRLVSRRVGQPRRRLGRRFHDRPGHVRNLPGAGRLGDARLPGRPSGFLGGACRRRTCSCGSGTRARSAAGALLRSGDLRLCAMPGQSPARRGRARARRGRQPARISARPGLVASPDHGRRLETGALAQDEAARRGAGSPRRLRLPRPRRRDVRDEPRARVRGKRRARAPAVARSSGRSGGPGGSRRVGPVENSPHARVPRAAGRRAGRVGSPRRPAGRARQGGGRPGPRARLPGRRGPLRGRARSVGQRRCAGR